MNKKTAGIQDVSIQEAHIRKIKTLAKEKNAVILAHNYQVPEVQDVADVVGDSLELSRKAAETDADIIVFCGVHFMAETAKILSPAKKVLLPDMGAGCSLADTIDADLLRGWKKEHPGAIVVSYVNTTAEVKAESDYCCTSANAVAIVHAIPREKEILFLPDMFLGYYVRQKTGRMNMHLWPGECHVHAGLRKEYIMKRIGEYPDAEVLIHPECGCTSQALVMVSECVPHVRFLGTGGMLAYVQKSSAQKFIIGTETGLIYRLKKENPEKEFIPLDAGAVCGYMKKITLEKVLRSLEEEKYEITVTERVANKAKKAIDLMISIH
ncbi:MAG: quinolinate synthase NadA [bacterium]|nr:quinolinate synthase NadA [bacterium]